jgi:hypothetical protein
MSKYECKIKVQKTDETGGQKITTEPYLVDALSYTEAESRINEEMSAYISEEFKITNIKVANYAEIHPLKIVIAGLNQKFLYWLMMKKVVKNERLVCIFSASKRCKRGFDNTMGIMQSTMGEYSIPAISESPIMDVFPYFSGEEKIEKFNALKAARPEVAVQIQRIL